MKMREENREREREKWECVSVGKSREEMENYN